MPEARADAEDKPTAPADADPAPSPPHRVRHSRPTPCLIPKRRTCRRRRRMRRRGRARRLMRMPPPHPQSAAEEDVLTPDAIPQPVCFVSQAEQPLDPPVPYMGDILLLQEGMSAGLFLSPTDHAHTGPTAKAARADACLTPHIHRWWLPPPPRRPTGAACAARPARWCTCSLRWAFVRSCGSQGPPAWPGWQLPTSRRP